MKLPKKDILNHYRTPEIQNRIIELSKDDVFCRWGNGDGVGWYKNTDGKKLPYNLSKESDYIHITARYRTLYWTLNFFDNRIFETDYNKVTQEESPLLSRMSTQGYTLAIDIDKAHGCDIHQPDVKKAVEDMGQYFCDKLREHAPNSIHVLFSGGGIYVLVHHKVIEEYFNRFRNSNEWERMFTILLNAYGQVINDLRESFFTEYPQHVGKVKPDSLNNSKRVFKSLFSIHLKQPYAVIPLNPDNVKIDFEKARLPLKKDVIDTGLNWYQSFDDDNGFLRFLTPYLERAKEELEHPAKYGNFEHSAFNQETDASNTPIDYDKFPPCIKNILNLPTCGEGRTRALALLAAFFGQAGIPKDIAQNIFYDTANRWGATTANIFSSYYKRMRVPTCVRLRSDDNTGFPAGVSIRALGVCKPTPHCIGKTSPRYVADRHANHRRIKDSFGKRGELVA
ncbi:MAG: hypothetical protein JXA38_05120 [Methanosarcinaceae archaeon]|nr:hypothetical protein [Methanosarcinaceae archaeon]